MAFGPADDALRRYRTELGTLGAAGAHALFPNDIEYYALTLELVDSKGFTVDSLFFPVMPKEIRDNVHFIGDFRQANDCTTVTKKYPSSFTKKY